MKIYKYPIKPCGQTRIAFPSANFQILSVGLDPLDGLSLWAIVEADEYTRIPTIRHPETEPLRPNEILVEVWETGALLSQNLLSLSRFLSTVRMGGYMLHVFLVDAGMGLNNVGHNFSLVNV